MLKAIRNVMGRLRDPRWNSQEWLLWQLFPHDNPATLAMRSMAMGAQAHALIETGWEDHMDAYEARDLVLLRRFIGRDKGRVLMDEAHRRARTRPERRVVAALRRIYGREEA